MRSFLFLSVLVLASSVAAVDVTITATATDATAAEPASTGQFTVKRTGDLTAALSVNLATSGTATSGADYVAIATTAVIPAGKSSVNVIVTPIDDGNAEVLETVVLTVLPGDYAVGAVASATVTLHDDERPTLSIKAIATSIGEAQSTTIDITRAGKLTDELTVNYSVSGTASNGVDYAALSGTAVISAGSATVQIPITVTNDTVAELNETVIVTLSAADAYNLTSANKVTVTILDDDLPVVKIATSDGTASEPGTDTGRLTLSRVGNAKNGLTVMLAIGGTANNGVDYQALADTVVIPANATSLSIYVRPIDDGLFEGSETVTLSLVGDAAYAIGSTPSGLVTIKDDENVVSLVATDATATEGGADNGTLTLSRTGSTAEDLTVNLSVTGTASNGTDYATIPAQATIPAGESAVLVTIAPTNDSLPEGDETVIVTLLSNPAYVLSTKIKGTVNLIDDELPAVSVKAADASASEPGTDTGRFTISRVGNKKNALAVQLQIGGTATNGVDYQLLSSTVTIPANATSINVDVRPIDDSLFEGSETVSLLLVPDAAYAPGTTLSGVVTLKDDDNVVSLVVTDATAYEALADTATFTLSRTGSTTDALAVKVTISGSAVNGTDYETLPLTFTIPAGQSSSTIVVTPKQDTTVENNETVTLTLVADAAYALSTKKQATATIIDDELPRVTFTVSPVSIAENAGTPVTATVSRVGNTLSALTIPLTVGGTATSGVDYSGVPESVVIPQGASSAKITVTIVNDAAFETNETVILTLSSGVGYQLGSPVTRTFTITNDDPEATPPIAVNDNYVAAKDTPLTVAAPGVLGNDTSAVPINAIKVTDPANGTLTLNPDGAFTYTPAEGYFGGDSFTYKASNAGGFSNIATVNIKVNAPPVAIADSYVTSKGVTLEIAAAGVLANDTDPNNDGVTASKVADPANGTVALNMNGSFVFTPAPAFTGFDSFAYRASDGHLHSNTVTVTIEVREPVVPTFSALTPADDSWTNSRRPSITGHVDGEDVDFDSLSVTVRIVEGVDQIALGGLTPDRTLNDFIVQFPYDVSEGEFRVNASVSNRAGQEGVANWKFKVDFTKPVLAGFLPELITTEPRPEFSATFGDALSGIAAGTAQLKLDGLEVTAQSTVGAGSIAFTPAADLAFGQHEYVFTVRDVAGNIATGTAKIIILDPNADTQPPIFGTVSPANNAFVSCALATPAAIHVPFSDDRSGIDLSSVTLAIDDQLVTLPVGAVTAAGLHYELPANFAESAHTWKVTVKDLAGNGPSEASEPFSVDSTPPVITLIAPSNTILSSASAQLYINGSVSDAGGSQIDWQALSVLVNGQQFAEKVSIAGLTFSVTEFLDSAVRVISLSVKDQAGNTSAAVQRTQTTALHHFAFRAANGVWSDLPSNDITLEFEQDKIYEFRCAFGDGIDPFTLSIQTFAVPIDILAPQNGFVYFNARPEFPFSDSLILRVQNLAHDRTYRTEGTLSFNSDTGQIPGIFVMTPGETGTNPPSTSIYATISAGSSISIVMTVDGVTVTPEVTGGSGFYDAIYTPTVLYSEGLHTYSITATDAYGRSSPVFNSSFTVRDEEPPAISVSSFGLTGIIKPEDAVITFDAYDFGYGIDPAQTRIEYNAGGQTRTAFPPGVEVDGFDGSFSYSHLFEGEFLDGEVVNYTIYVTENSRAGGFPPAMTQLSGSFTIDSAAPAISGFSPASGANIAVDTRDFDFIVTENVSGINFVAASLQNTVTQQYVHSDSYSNSGALRLTLPANVTLEGGVRYALIVSAYDNVFHQGYAQAEFVAGTDTTGPTITINPADGTTTTSMNVTVTVQDAGSGIESSGAGVNALLDGESFTPLSTGYNANLGRLTLNFRLPIGTMNGAHNLSVSAQDLVGNSNTAASLFSLNKPFPPTPVIQETLVGTDLVTLSGTIPAFPSDLTRIVVEATGAIAETNFDRSTMTWQVVLTRDNSTTTSYSVRYQDLDLRQSPTPASGSRTYASGPSTPPLVPPNPAPPPPPGSVPEDVEPMAIYCDYLAADITGVTSKARGLLPATNKSSVRIFGSVFGIGGPYTIEVTGGLTATETVPTGRFEVEVQLPTEGVRNNIVVQATDTRGKKVKYSMRSLVVDRTAPAVDADLHIPLFTSPLKLDSNTLSYGAQETTGSGIVQVELREYPGLGTTSLFSKLLGDILVIQTPVVPGPPSGNYPPNTSYTWRMRLIDAAGNRSVVSKTVTIGEIPFGKSYPSPGTDPYTGTSNVIDAEIWYEEEWYRGLNFPDKVYVNGVLVSDPAQPAILNFPPGFSTVSYVETGISWYGLDELFTPYTLNATLSVFTPFPQESTELSEANLLVDENNNESTSDESADRQAKFGVAIPPNDDFELGATANGRLKPDNLVQSGATSRLRLVTFKLPGGKVKTVSISGPKMWRTRSRGTEVKSKIYDLEKPSDVSELAALGGRFYVEMPPDVATSGVSVSVGNDTSTTGAGVALYAIADKSQGAWPHAPRVAVGGPAEVNLASGALECSWPLIRSGSAIIPDISVYYCSRNTSGNAAPVESGVSSGLPLRFQHNLDMKLLRTAEKLFLRDGDGSIVEFKPAQPLSGTDDSSAIWEPLPHKGEFSTIKTVSREDIMGPRKYYVLMRAAANRQYLFEKDTGKLAEIRDAFGNWARLDYEEYRGTRGKLLAVVDNRGVFVKFNGSTVSDTLSRSASVTSGGIASPIGNHSFKLSPLGRIYSFNNALGAEFIVNVDPGDQNKPIDSTETSTTSKAHGVVYNIYRGNDERTLSVDHVFSSSFATVRLYEKAGDPARRYDYTYDPHLNIWESIRYDTLPGKSVTLTQAATPQRLIEYRTNQLGGKTSFKYNEVLGLVTEVADPDTKTFKTAYKQLSNPRFDAAGPNYLNTITLLDKTTDGKGQITQYDYNSDRFLSSVSDTIGVVSIQEWDEFGLPQKKAGPRAGYEQTIVYDEFGRVQSTSASGGGVQTGATAYRTDGLGQLREVTTPDGRKMRYGYDTQGNQTYAQGPLVTDAELAAGIAHGGVSSAAYINAGACIAQRDADGRQESRSFNTLGALTSMKDAAQAETVFENFDALLQPRTTKLPGVKDTDPPITIQHDRDLTGREIKRTLPPLPTPAIASSGHVTFTGTQPREILTAHDDSKMTVTVTPPGQPPTVAQMLPSGRSKSVTAPLQAILESDHDGNGDPVVSTRSGWGKQSTSLNQYGLPDFVKTEGVALDTTFMRDVTGHAHTTVLPGSIEIKKPADSMGRVKLTSIGDTEVSEAIYDDNDPQFRFVPKKIKDRESGAETEVDKLDAYYRATNWRTQVVTPVPFSAVSPYDAIPASRSITGAATFMNTGGRKTFIDGKGGVSTVQRDAAQREVGSTDQSGLGNSVALSKSGYVLTSTDDRGKTSEFIYDSTTGFLKAKRFPDGKGVAYAHDVNGNVTAETYANVIENDGTVAGAQFTDPDLNKRAKTIVHTYDNLNRLKTTSLPVPSDKVTEFSYYNSGLKATVKNPDGRVMKFVYDPAGRMVEQSESPGGRRTTWKYHANGQPERITYPDGSVTSCSYDGRGRKTSQTSTREGTTTFHYDGNGDMDFMTDATGKVTKFKYDNAHRLVETILPADSEVQFQRVITRGYDDAGYLERMTDPKGQNFGIQNHANGRRDKLHHLSGAGTQLRGTYSWDGNTPTSDGAVSWTLDPAGRVTSDTGGAAYKYDHPMGFMTEKAYAGMTLAMAYDADARLKTISDGANTVTFTRTSGNVLKQAAYSSGIEVTYDHTDQLDIKKMEYKKGGDILASFNATYDNFGKRKTLTIAPTGESFAFGYDAALRLSSETRNYPGFSGNTEYRYDAVGNRTQKIVDGAGSDLYTYNARYELTRIRHGDGSQTALEYDLNGNTTKKTKYPVTTVTVAYKNLTSSEKHCTLFIAGVEFGKLSFAGLAQGDDPTQYKSLSFNVYSPLNLELKIEADDAAYNSGGEITVDKIAISGPVEHTYEAEGVTLTGVTVVSDTLASAGLAVNNFGETAGDSIAVLFSGVPGIVETTDYEWDVLNRLTSATLSIGNIPQKNATFTHAATHGWQVATQTVNTAAGAEVRNFTYGHSGELLSESIPNIGTRSYVNASIDHVMWTKDGGANTRFWLHDISGSVFGVTDSAGSVTERQRFDAFGNTELTTATGIPLATSSIGNRLGFQGRTNIGELGFQHFRNRCYDPQIGRFLSMDPLGMIDGPNMYGFCGGDPVNRSDPMGLAHTWNGTQWVPDKGSENDPEPPMYREGMPKVWLGPSDIAKVEKMLDEGDITAADERTPAQHETMGNVTRADIKRLQRGDTIRAYFDAFAKQAVWEAHIETQKKQQRNAGMIMPGGYAQSDLAGAAKMVASAGDEINRLQKEIAVGVVTDVAGGFFITKVGRLWKAFNASKYADDSLDFMAELGRREGKLFGSENMAKLKKGLDKWDVKVVENADEFLKGKEANAAFDPATKTIYLKGNPTRYEVLHEVSHALDYRKAKSLEAYLKVSQMGRERSVVERLWKSNWNQFSDIEKYHNLEHYRNNQGILSGPMKKEFERLYPVHGR